MDSPYEMPSGCAIRAPAGPGANGFISFIALHLDGRHRARGRRADRRALGDERLPEGGAQPHALGRSRTSRSARQHGAMPDWQRRAAMARQQPARGGRRAVRRAQAMLARGTSTAASWCAASTRARRRRSPTIAEHMRAGRSHDLHARRIRHRARRRARARARRARRRQDHRRRCPGGTVTPAGMLPRLKKLSRRRHLRGRNVRVRQRRSR